jgi:hypothetical protein
MDIANRYCLNIHPDLPHLVCFTNFTIMMQLTMNDWQTSWGVSNGVFCDQRSSQDEKI